MTRPFGGAASAAITFCGVAALAASCGPNGPLSTGAEPSPIIICGETPTSNGDGTGSIATEWYVPQAMNRKLENYPDFAKVAGVTSVSTCDDARTLMSAYGKYASLHPGFDIDQPTQDDPIEVSMGNNPVGTPAGHTTTAQVPKIFGGTTAQLMPVVETSFFWPQGYSMCPYATGCQQKCTGTFIAKNFVVTAAHCVATLNLPKRPPNGVASWGFTFSDSLGNTGQNFVENNAIQYIDSRFMGWVPAGTGADMTGPNNVGVSPFDFAIVYIPKQDDVLIPVQADGTPATLSVALDYGLSQLCSDGEQIWSWGPDTPGEGFMSTTGLCMVQPIDRSVPGQFTVTFPTTNADGTTYSGPFICRGDSGGPWVDDIGVSFGNGLTGSVQAVTGVLDGAAGFVFEWDTGSTCTGPGSQAFFSVTYPELTFIQSTMQKWNGTLFVCDRYTGTNGNVGVAQCQLDPCAQDDDCCAMSDLSPAGTGKRDCSGTTRWFCDHPGGGGAYQGTCLPAPRPSPPDGSVP